MSKVTERLTFANVMSVVAVFIALGGGAYAAKLAKDSVKSKQIAANAVKESELASNAVTNPKIAGAAVTADKLADGSVTTAKIADGAVNGAKVNEASLGQVPLAAVATKASNTHGAIVNADGTLSSAAQSGTTRRMLVRQQRHLLGRFRARPGELRGGGRAGQQPGQHSQPRRDRRNDQLRRHGDRPDPQLRGRGDRNGFELIVVC